VPRMVCPPPCPVAEARVLVHVLSAGLCLRRRPRPRTPSCAYTSVPASVPVLMPVSRARAHTRIRACAGTLVRSACVAQLSCGTVI